MKTEKQIRAMLAETEQDLKDTTERFHRYDNYEDMEQMKSLQSDIATLKWVLGDK